MSSFIVNLKEDSANRCFTLEDCQEDFPDIQTLRKEQEICVVNLARREDLLGIVPTGFGKS